MQSRGYSILILNNLCSIICEIRFLQEKKNVQSKSAFELAYTYFGRIELINFDQILFVSPCVMWIYIYVHV